MPALLLTIPFAIIFWFLLVRPQQRRAQEHRELVMALEVGDRVVTFAGIYGEILQVSDETVELNVAPGVALTFARQAISRRLDDREVEAVDGTPTTEPPNELSDPTDPTGEDVA